MEHDSMYKYEMEHRRSMIERQSMLMSTMLKILLIAVVMFLVMIGSKSIGGILTQYERILSAEASGMERLPKLRKQIETLEQQITALSNSSIESRLSTIEKAIKTGDLSVDEIATLQQLLSDFKVLKSYMFEDPEDLVKLKTLQRDYSELLESNNHYMKSPDIMREIGFLQNMFYSIIGLFGILVSLVGGSWWFASRRTKKEAQE